MPERRTANSLPSRFQRGGRFAPVPRAKTRGVANLLGGEKMGFAKILGAQLGVVHVQVDLDPGAWRVCKNDVQYPLDIGFGELSSAFRGDWRQGFQLCVRSVAQGPPSLRPPGARR